MTCSNFGEQLLDCEDSCNSSGERRFKIQAIVCFFALLATILAIFSLAVEHVPEGHVEIVTDGNGNDFTVEKVDIWPQLMMLEKDGLHRYVPSEDGHWIEIEGEVKRELTPDKTAEFANHFEEDQP